MIEIILANQHKAWRQLYKLVALLFDNGGIWSGKLPKFFIFLELFSNSNENERFPSLSEEELANLGSKNQNKSKSTKIG